MAHNKLYRNFIILQEDERGYSHSNDKALSGYAKVEAKGDKCKISFYAQNLRQDDNYSMVLICCKRDLKQLIDIGPLAINEVGKGDTSKEYYVNNIAGLGISYEKISGAAICKVKDNETEFVMHGFMNGEESTENWRKFKIVKVDSKKYIDKTALQSKEKNNTSTDVAPKAIIPQSIGQETNLVKTTELQNDLAERKKDEDNLQPKANIESTVEDKQNRIPENHPNIAETIDNLDEERHKNKENKKCEKDDKHDHDKCDKKDKCDKQDYDKCDKKDKCDKQDYDKWGKKDKCDKQDYDKCDKKDNCNKYDYYKFEKEDKYDKQDYNKWEKEDKYDNYYKHDYYEKEESVKEESVEEIIIKLSKKLEVYDGMIDLNVSHHIYENVIVYGFIKDKKNYNSKWKKFRLEKKCRNNVQDLEINNIQFSSRRLDENFNLDKLSDAGRLDTIDFDEYENNIQQGNLSNNTGSTDTGAMGQAGTNVAGTGKISGTTTKQAASNTEMNQVNPETIWQPWSANTMKQADAGINQTGTNIGSTEAPTEANNEIKQPKEETMWQPLQENTVNQMESGNAGQTSSNGETNQNNTGAMGQLDLGYVEEPKLTKINQTTPNEGFSISGDIGKYFEKLAQGFQPFIGKLSDINFCKWYKIIVNGIEDLSNESNYNQYTLAYYPMLNYYPYISKIGHYLLGYKCNKNGEMQYIIYAIPGSKEKSDQPYGGRTGFVTWTADDKNNQGYWLMFYDFKNSSIVIPAR